MSTALGHASDQPSGGGSCCFEGAREVLSLLDDDGLFTLGCGGCSYGGFWRGGTIGKPVASVVPKDLVLSWVCSSLAIVCCCLSWLERGGYVCWTFGYPPHLSTCWGCLDWPLTPLPPLKVAIMFLSKSFMCWRRVCSNTPSSLVGSSFHFSTLNMLCCFCNSSVLVIFGGKYFKSTSIKRLCTKVSSSLALGPKQPEI